MLDLQVFRVGEVFNLEEFLYLFHPLLREGDDLVFFVDDEISGLGDLLAHDRRHLCDLAARLASLELACQNVRHLVELRGLAALSGNDQRGTRLVDQNGVDLVDDRIVQTSLHKLLLVDHHVVTQVVKTKLVVGNVGNVAVVHFAALVVVHVV